MPEVVYSTKTHFVVCVDSEKYQVLTIETLWPCGYFKNRAKAIKKANQLSESRQLTEQAASCG